MQPAKSFVDSVITPPKLEIGLECHHKDGRKVKITSGQYWGTHGISNFWYWCEILENGELGPQECGYGRDLVT